MSTGKPAERQCCIAAKDGLGEAELDFAVELLTWLCHRNIIGTIAMRNAMLELRSYNPGTTSRIGGTR